MTLQPSTLTYRPWDREEKLGQPPWKADDPKVVAWEAAHGHDVRLKCYPELGCQLLPTEEDYERLRDAAQALLADWDERYKPASFQPHWDAMEALRVALAPAEDPA